MPDSPPTDTEAQRRKFARIVWLLLACTTAAQLPWLYSIHQLSVPRAYLIGWFVFANSQLLLRLRYLPKPGPPPSWWERWVIWPYFTWAIWAGFYLPVGLYDCTFDLPTSGRVIGLIITALMSLYSTGVPYRRVVVRTANLTLPNLPPEASGMRLAQVTDVHLGPMVPEHRVTQWMHRINDLDVDHVLLTGDLITSGIEHIPSLKRALSVLRPKGYVYTIMGNHDYFGDASEELLKMHEELGHIVLRNRSVQITPGLHISGVDDAWRRLTDLDAALSEIPDSACTILLSHDPDLFPESAKRAVSLQVSGHIHGGQLAVPFCGRAGSILRLFGVPWIQGLYSLHTSTLWVGAGLGTTGIPVRFGVPSEIPVLQLHSSPPHTHPV